MIPSSSTLAGESEKGARAQADPIGHQLALMTVPQEIYD